MTKRFIFTIMAILTIATMTSCKKEEKSEPTAYFGYSFYDGGEKEDEYLKTLGLIKGEDYRFSTYELSDDGKYKTIYIFTSGSIWCPVYVCTIEA